MSKKQKLKKETKTKKGNIPQKKAVAQVVLPVSTELEQKVQVSPDEPPRLKKKYQEEIVPYLMKELQLKNINQVPRLVKIVINCAVKEAVRNPKVLENVFQEIKAIAGQCPVLTRAQRAVAAFGVRVGNALGICVTLRRARMYEFLDRFIHVVLPSVRDFHGLKLKSFDGKGNYSVGVQEQGIFPEVNDEKIDQIRGMTISIVTNAKNNEHGKALLTQFGMPFQK